MLIVAVCAAVVLTLLVGVGVYGLVLGPQQSASPAPAIRTVEPSPSVTLLRTDELPRIAVSGDPVVYARSVASALFSWDTASDHGRREYLDVLISEAPTDGAEVDGLIADLEGYFPTAEQWGKLREYRTRQYLSIAEAGVPEGWERIVQDARDRVAEGTVAVTVRGTRHRAGVWEDVATTSEHGVAFTVFVSCTAGVDRCRLLRLSGLGTPLEDR